MNAWASLRKRSTPLNQIRWIDLWPLTSLLFSAGGIGGCSEEDALLPSWKPLPHNRSNKWTNLSMEFSFMCLSWVMVITFLHSIVWRNSISTCFGLLCSFVQTVRDGWLTCGATAKIGIIVNLPNSNWRKSEFQSILKNANKIHQLFLGQVRLLRSPAWPGGKTLPWSFRA